MPRPLQLGTQPTAEAIARDPAQELALPTETGDDARDVERGAAGERRRRPGGGDDDVHQRFACDGDHGVGESCLAPVMIATASSGEVVAVEITPAQCPSRWMCTRSATCHTCGMLWLIRITGRP